MEPGNSQILTCPFCGTEKEILSLLSWNTFGQVYWSDGKREAPGAPEISYVQKCPQCGKYYIRKRQEVRFSEDNYSFEQGLLTFSEKKEAFAQLSSEGFIKKDEECEVRLMLHFAYNDFSRSGEEREFDVEDKIFFRENVLWLIDNCVVDNVMKAEFYREIGEFELAREILESTEIKSDFLMQVAAKILARVKHKDHKVFKIIDGD